VPFDLQYEFDVRAGADEVFAVLADVPLSASHFPKVHALVPLGRNAFRWELERVGTQKIGIQTVYASKYVSDPKKHSVTWTPVEGEGNARVSGRWSITPKKGATHVVLDISGQVNVPLPALTRLVVEPIVRNENEKLIEQYIANLIVRFGGEV
jgi:carbon monoxide dehydrogenase subunit G